MSTDVAEGAHGAHEHEEVSWAPMAVAFGTMLFVPIVFTLYFVYNQPFFAMVAAGIGAPLLLAGIARWIHEGATQPALVEGVSPLGIGVFIIGEILMFLGLFASYWTMRISTGAAGDPWPPAGTPHINLILPLIMTVLLVGSSMTYHYGEHLFEKGDKGGFKMWLVITMLLGGAFLGCTIYEYAHLMHEGFLPGTNQYSTAFYSITGFHGSHVILGLIGFLVMLIGAFVGKIHLMFVKVLGIYWHFVDLIWFFVATQIYYW